jgi:glucokinase
MNEGDRFLVADVGATKVHFFLALFEKGGATLLREEKFLCKDFESLEEAITRFLEKDKVNYLTAGVPGPVKNGRCKPTNLRWTIDEDQISQRCKISKVVVVNDLRLLGAGISSLKDEDLIVLQKGEKDLAKPKAIVSVGTGLGEGVVFEGKVLATEGGHEDFAAFTDQEIDFVKFMRKKLDHISYERVLSGDGIENVYEFFSGKRNKRAGEIFSSDDSLCKKTREFFLEVLGKESGNLSLKTLCNGGLYLTGGVLQKNALLLQQQGFIESFQRKGRFSDLLKTVPIYLIKTDKALLIGGLNLL